MEWIPRCDLCADVVALVTQVFGTQSSRRNTKSTKAKILAGRQQSLNQAPFNKSDAPFNQLFCFS